MAFKKDKKEKVSYEGPEDNSSTAPKKSSKPVNKKVIVIAAIVIALIVIIGIIVGVIANGFAAAPSPAPARDYNLEEDADEFKKLREEAEGKADESDEEEDIALEELYDNPLDECDYIDYMGSIDLNGDSKESNTARGLVNKLIDEKDIDPEKVLAVCADDFEQNGQIEVFLLEGEDIADDEFLDYIEGTFYYADEDETIELDQSRSEMWYDRGRVFKFPGRTYFAITESFATGAPTSLLSVYDGKMECELNNLGFIDVDGDYIVLRYDSYDAFYEPTTDFSGHTWKPHYLKFYEWDAKIIDCWSKALSFSEVINICGSEVADYMEENEAYFLTAYERENGIVNINYIINEEYGCELKNATWSEKRKSFIDDYNNVSSFEDSNLGGFFRKSILSNREVMDNPNNELRVSIAIYSTGCYIETNSQVFLYGDVFDYEKDPEVYKMAFIIDDDTDVSEVAANNEKGFDYIKKLIHPDEDMIMNGDTIMGVWDVTLKGSHVESVNGLYWWD